MNIMLKTPSHRFGSDGALRLFADRIVCIWYKKDVYLRVCTLIIFFAALGQ